MAKKSPPYEVLLVTYGPDADGNLLITDIIETSNHFAPKFVRRFMRIGLYPDSTHFSCFPPGDLHATREKHPLPR